MSRKVNSIADIDDSKETWKLGVRITHLWTKQRSPKPFIETIFLDNKVLVANGWCYEGCPKCNMKCEEKLFPFICVGCQNENSSTVLRFRLEVKVSHHNDSLKFVMWNKEFNLLINQTDAAIKNQLIQEVWICQE
ncbi:hypothetical protein AAZX31_01G054300 [Glycine max]|uniref:Replication factor A C-terminal domain-containing protein n=2 Tax=Glycine subgen. Soja TaxID=1462606 RepID=K7K220_SOYBN|nr:hypothetical protein JHK86_000579 [Glycine max]KHN03643.1 hypothetical protein glysoja_031140 [Glycine soja]KAH1161797.1 hypothetical protein GYH30_000601 [Glycine max]KAH1264740.1 hypothetical protein GmHk_01G000590 [Glycine max]KRH75024.1 hypothetical protein GLYMA_01G057700v4 [Glycine max]|eukprot:XP_025983643.1 uncharacterized protein LOC102660841 [Glycine max]